MEMTPRMQQAYDHFYEGYNCAQAVLLSFTDVTGLDRNTSAMLASSFGGGMGRMREVCGAVSAILMVAGIVYGYATPETGEIKAEHYERVRNLADEFKKEYQTIICRELLANVETAEGGTPEARTEEYYRKRPCGRFIAAATGILERYLISHPLNGSPLLHN